MSIVHSDIKEAKLKKNRFRSISQFKVALTMDKGQLPNNFSFSFNVNGP